MCRVEPKLESPQELDSLVVSTLGVDQSQNRIVTVDLVWLNGMETRNEPTGNTTSFKEEVTPPSPTLVIVNGLYSQWTEVNLSTGKKPQI